MSDNGDVLVEKAKREETDRFACPSCGANIKFDPSSQALVCPYCDNKVEIISKKDDIQEYCFFSATKSIEGGWGKEKRSIHCDSCGADTVLGDDITSQFCPFCGSSYIVKDIEKGGIAPESLLPFKISAIKAKECFVKWMSKRFFAPKALKNEYAAQNLKGIYIPFWTYDSNTKSTYKAEAGTYYYVNETRWVVRNGKKQQETVRVRKTRWWPTSGDYSQYFDDVLVNGSKNANQKFINTIAPYNLKELVHYKPEFLSGFMAERYSVDLVEGWEKAKVSIDSDIRSGVIRKINADEVRNLRINTKYEDIKYKHTLLPVWISSYSYRGKIYQFMINGQTGKVQGQAPTSPLKVAGAVLLFIAAAGGIVWVLNHFANGGPY